jgi:hypothetical protein
MGPARPADVDHQDADGRERAGAMGLRKTLLAGVDESEHPI